MKAIIDIAGKRPSCNDKCQAMIEKWYNWLLSDHLFGKHVMTDGCIIHEHLLAMIPLFTDYQTYRAKTNRECGSLIRKAENNGYEGKVVDYNDHLLDIYNVNTSMEYRQGKEMAEGYSIYPRSITHPQKPCDIHFDRTYGVLKDGILYAYAQVSFVNDLAVINRILGHGEHRIFRVMNLLIATIVEDCYKQQYVKYLNYLTMPNTSLGAFKRSVGFEQTECKFKKVHL